MRVLPIGLLLVIVSLSLTADEAVWKMDLRQRAIRRADPVENARRHAAAVARGRQAPPPDVNVVEGSYDPTILAPIELIQQVYPVYNLGPDRQRKFRREWESRGAVQLLGKDYWERLRVVFARPIFLDHEVRRVHALPAEAVSDADPPQGYNDGGECEAEAEALKAGRAAWGEAFERFLYEVVAPGVYYWTSSSDPASLTKPENWLDEWQFSEKGCR